MTMRTADDLFEHELLDMYDAEHQLTRALPKLAKEAVEPELKQGFEKHLEQTKGHIQRIEQACELLGVEAKREPCAGMAGLLKEHDRFLTEKPSPEVLTLFIMDAAQKTEHYEIVGYKGLISMAGLLGHKDVAQLLKQTLTEEKTMAKELESLEEKREKTLVAQAS